MNLTPEQQAERFRVLLDALEACGVPRESLQVGAGNAWVATGKSNDELSIHGMVLLPQGAPARTSATITAGDRVELGLEAGGVTLIANLNKERARNLGAFLLAWSFAP